MTKEAAFRGRPSDAERAGEDAVAPRAHTRSFGQLLGSQALLAAVGLACLPILARNLGPAAYGRFSLFVLVLGLLSGLDLARPILVRRLSSKRGELPSEAAPLAASSAWLLTLVALPVGHFVGGVPVALGLAVCVHLHGLAALPFAALSAAGRVGVGGSIRSCSWALALAGVVLLSFFTRSAFAWVGSFVLASALVLVVSHRAAGTRVLSAHLPSLGVLARHRRAALDVLGFAVASAVVAACDRLLLDHHVDADAFGCYAAQYDLAIKVNVVSTAIGNVLFPMLARSFSEEGELAAARRFVRVSSAVAAAYFVGLLVLVVFSADVARLALGDGIVDGDVPLVVPLFFVGVFVHLFGFLVTPYQRASGDYATHRRAYVASAAITVLAGALLVPRFGVHGAVATYLVSRVAEVVLVVVEARRIPRAALGSMRLAGLACMLACLVAAAAFALREGGLA
ncbi:MAG: hypothetical protein AAFZ87_02510 [Planctomycetota bacterium]